MERSTITSIESAVLRTVARSLRRESIGRLDELCVFGRLGADVQREICALEVAREAERLKHLGYDLVVSRDAVELLIREGFYSGFCARHVRKTVEREIQNAVLRSLLAAELAKQQGNARLL